MFFLGSSVRMMAGMNGRKKKEMNKLVRTQSKNIVNEQEPVIKTYLHHIFNIFQVWKLLTT